MNNFGKWSIYLFSSLIDDGDTGELYEFAIMYTFPYKNNVIIFNMRI